MVREVDKIAENSSAVNDANVLQRVANSEAKIAKENCTLGNYFPHYLMVR